MLNPLKIQTNGNEDLLNDSLKAFFNNMVDKDNLQPASQQNYTEASEKRLVFHD
jgi:hypothetical protein